MEIKDEGLMFVISADQRGSRAREDLVGPAREAINDQFGDSLALPADRNAGDEIQLLTDSAATVLDITIMLARTGNWSIGIGVGTVRTPLPGAVGEATGDAFIAARDAVTAAKRRQTRVAVRGGDLTDAAWPTAEDAQSLLDPLLELLRRRSGQGWELHDVLTSAPTQADAAHVLGITAAAVSDRAKVAALKIERDARKALVRLLENLATTATTP
ncbi:SatD family protein [Homoserinimonas hongtaonis]|nr:SatD family protein [Salinibacterium hongtaonis]